MRIFHSIAELRSELRSAGPIALVPTMGNLHEGHLSLLRIAREHAAQTKGGLVAASVFVNPLQFAPHEDYAGYPRTFERDCELLAREGCDIVFAPSVAEMYPAPQSVFVEPPATLAGILEGAVRPGFFRGVCTVVLKLLNVLTPRVAVFGRKDYQQWLIVRRMVRELSLDIEIIAGETVRDSSGLALSSRNGYLSAVERREAAQLHQHLLAITREVASGRSDFAVIEAAAMQSLASRGWQPDYVSVRRRCDLSVPAAYAPGELVVLGAARLGKTRLIDNLEL